MEYQRITEIEAGMREAAPGTQLRNFMTFQMEYNHQIVESEGEDEGVNSVTEFGDKLFEVLSASATNWLKYNRFK